jgi:glycine/D-amino acid oxidase-like deaminating enzyme
MLKLPVTEKSYWKEAHKRSLYPRLAENITVDVAIAGGGITGLCAAYLLKKSGLRVAVLEKNRIGSGTTGGTTGKVTSQHNLIYDELKKRLGKKAAKVYAEANQAALQRIGQLIDQEKFDCDWEIADNYVFTADPSQVAAFKKEAKVAAGLGLPATFETDLPLPFEVHGAVKFAAQAKMHAQKYVLGLAAAVNGQGSHVFENSNVVSFHDGEPASISTKHATVTAEDIIVATKIPAAPLVARFSYAALVHPHTSYIVAARLKQELDGMYISPDKDHYSILPVRAGKKQLLLIGGENHTPGLGNPHSRHQRLADYAERHFDVSSISYRWKAMDYLAYDDVPLIGRVYPWSKHLYVATGFKKWGLTTSMVAGMILNDTINGHQNPWAQTFDSTRLKPIASIPGMVARKIVSAFS